MFLKILTLTFFIASSFSSLPVQAFPIDYKFHNEGKVQNGRVAFVATGEERVVEVDLNGNITWDYKIPKKFINPQFSISRGPDIKWIKENDSFLVTVPKLGVFQIGRNKEILWFYLTNDISHDADLLDDGSVIFVNGWDEIGDTIITHIDKDKKLIKKYTASDLSIKPESQIYMREGNTHINAITYFGEDRFMVSIRNYHRISMYDKGQIVWEIRNAFLTHDPVLIDERVFYAHRERRRQKNRFDQSIVKYNLLSNQRSTIWSAPDEGWTPLRTLEYLDNGNLLITGSSKIGQVTLSGELVWEIDFKDFEHQARKTSRTSNTIYKATFVYMD